MQFLHPGSCLDKSESPPTPFRSPSGSIRADKLKRSVSLVAAVDANSKYKRSVLQLNPPTPVLTANKRGLISSRAQLHLQILSECLAVHALVHQLLILTWEDWEFGRSDMDELVHSVTVNAQTRQLPPTARHGLR